MSFLVNSYQIPVNILAIWQLTCIKELISEPLLLCRAKSWEYGGCSEQHGDCLWEEVWVELQLRRWTQVSDWVCELQLRRWTQVSDWVFDRWCPLLNGHLCRSLDLGLTKV